MFTCFVHTRVSFARVSAPRSFPMASHGPRLRALALAQQLPSSVLVQLSLVEAAEGGPTGGAAGGGGPELGLGRCFFLGSPKGRMVRWAAGTLFFDVFLFLHFKMDGWGGSDGENIQTSKSSKTQIRWRAT